MCMGWPCFPCRTILLAPGRSVLLSRFSPSADSNLSERLLFLAQMWGEQGLYRGQG